MAKNILNTFKKLFLMLTVPTLFAACDSKLTTPRKYLDPNDVKEVDKDLHVSYYNDLYTEAQLSALYFVEIFFRSYAQDDYKVQRITSDPYFWFSDHYNSPGAALIRQFLTEGTEKLTGGRFKAHFLSQTTSPATFEEEKTYIRIGFTAGIAHGVASWNNNEAGRIYKAYLNFMQHYATTDDFDQLSGLKTIVFHELGHAIGNATHSGQVGNMMTYNNDFGQTNVIPQFELDAWDHYFSLPIGTTLGEIKASGDLADYVEPKIYPFTVNIEGKGKNEQKNPIEYGDTIEVYGASLFYDFGCHSGISDMKVTVNGVELEFLKPTLTFDDILNGTCTNALRAKVTSPISSGNLIIERDGKVGEPIYVYAN